MSVRALVLRFTLAGVITTALVAAITAFASVTVGTRLAIADARRTTWITASGIVAPALDDGVLRQERASLDRLDEAVRLQVLREGLMRVKIWDRHGRIVYSDEPRLIGELFEIDPEDLALFDSPPANSYPEAEVSDLNAPENRFETDAKLLEVYMPMQTTDGTIVLYEAYFRYDAVTDVGRDLWRRFAPLGVGGLVILELVQIPFAWRLARRLRSGQEDRELLLRHAIEASEKERRRIASDLHDGVVQDLTGVSLQLAAAARGAGADPRLADASGAIRESVRSLRSLLVDIYPPNLYEEGLESALGDLLGRIKSRGIATELNVAQEAAQASRSAVALLYRVAQEALRNVVSHSGARNVTVSVRMIQDQVQLAVTDDGRGVDVNRIATRQRSGHVGLRALAGLVRDSGGQLTLRSAPGSGTSLVVTLPWNV